MNLEKSAGQLSEGDRGTVFVFDAKDLPESEYKNDPNVELLREIKYPDGKIGYRIVKIRE